MRVHEFAADIRHQRFGSALTYNETKLANAFLPSAGGLDLMDRATRIDSFADNLRNQVRSIDNIMDTSFLERLPEYNKFNVTEEMVKNLKTSTGFSPPQAKMYDTYNQLVSDLEQDNAEYRAATGEDMPEYLEAMKMRNEFKSGVDRKNMNRSQQRSRGRGR